MNGNEENEEDNRRTERQPTRRTNWQRRSEALTQLHIYLWNYFWSVLLEMISFTTELINLLVIIIQLPNFNPNFATTQQQVKEQIVGYVITLLYHIGNIIDQMNDIIYVDNSLLEPFTPKKNRRINDITDEWARTNTRFSKDELRRLL